MVKPGRNPGGSASNRLSPEVGRNGGLLPDSAKSGEFQVDSGWSSGVGWSGFIWLGVQRVWTEGRAVGASEPRHQTQTQKHVSG
jgi:hypothetical protein